MQSLPILEVNSKEIEIISELRYIDKYAKVATVESIKTNDYNLNIPRYVDTFEAEEQIDLDAVAEELKALDIAGLETDKTIASFCNELGIEPPFKVK
jgi:type I restriction enzyme M protein